MKTLYIYLMQGNVVKIDGVEINSFKSFNEAWTFCNILSQTIECTGRECLILTQGGTWLCE